MSDEKIAVVTGASRGLGLVIAKEFNEHGWQVIGTGRSDRPAALPAAAAYQQFDASDASACEAFWRQLADDHPGVQICLVNNAGDYVSGGLGDTAAQAYASQMQSIYFSAVYMTKAMATHFSKARIVNIISSSALAAHKNNSAYGAAKSAEMHFFQSLQHEFKPAQYQITNLYPDNIASQGPDPAAIDPRELAAFVRAQVENTATYYLRDASLYTRNT